MYDNENFKPENTIVYDNGTFWFPEILGSSHSNLSMKSDYKNETESKSLKSENMHPLLKETMCFFFNTDDNNNCIIKDVNIVFRSDFSYQTERNIIFKNGKYKCQFFTDSYCNIMFNLTGSAKRFELTESSLLIGEQVVIIGANIAVRIDNTSLINVTATSDQQTGTLKNQGASYLSEGGTCVTVIRKTYGYFNLLPNIKNPLNLTVAIGSQGISGDIYTNGGGRVILIVDSLRIEGKGDKIQANGGPLPINRKINNDFTVREGGSGGYIYIKTSQNITKNSIESGARIVANGGHGKNGGNGGAGGQIIFEKLLIDINYVTANPGQTLDYMNNIDLRQTQICRNGGPGMIYFVDLDLLSINSAATSTTKKTYLLAQSNQITYLNQLELKNYTKIILQNTKEFIINTQLRTFWNTSISTEYASDYLNMRIGFQNFIDPETYLNFGTVGRVNISTTSINAMQIRFIRFKTSLDIQAGSLIIKQPSLSPITRISSSYINLRASQDLNFTQESMRIIAPKISLMGNRSINFAQNVTISTIALQSMNPTYQALQDIKSSSLNEKLLLKDSIRIAPQADKYDLYLYSNTRINTNFTYFQSQSLGIRATNITLNNASINAASTTQPIILYAVNSVIVNRYSNITGKKVWITAANVILTDTLNITNSQIDTTTTGGSEQSDYHIAIIADKEFRFNQKSIFRGSSVYFSTGQNMHLASQTIQTLSTKIQPSVYIQSGGIINFTNTRDNQISIQSQGQISINAASSIVKTFYGSISIQADIQKLSLTQQHQANQQSKPTPIEEYLKSTQRELHSDSLQVNQLKLLQQKQGQSLSIISGEDRSNNGILLQQLNIQAQSISMQSQGSIELQKLSMSTSDNTKDTVISSQNGFISLTGESILQVAKLKISALNNVYINGTDLFKQQIEVNQDTQIISQQGGITLNRVELKTPQSILSSNNDIKLIQVNINSSFFSTSTQKRMNIQSISGDIYQDNVQMKADQVIINALGLITLKNGNLAGDSNMQIIGGMGVKIFNTNLICSYQLLKALQNAQISLQQINPYSQQTLLIQSGQAGFQLMDTTIMTNSLYIDSIGSIQLQDSQLRVTERVKDFIIRGKSDLKLSGKFSINASNMKVFIEKNISIDGKSESGASQVLQIANDASLTSINGDIEINSIYLTSTNLALNSSSQVTIQNSNLNVTIKNASNIQPNLLISVNDSVTILYSTFASTNIFVSTVNKKVQIRDSNLTAERHLFVQSGDLLDVKNALVIQGQLSLKAFQGQLSNSLNHNLEQSQQQSLQLLSGLGGLRTQDTIVSASTIFMSSSGDISLFGNNTIRVTDDSKELIILTKKDINSNGTLDIQVPSLNFNAFGQIQLLGVEAQRQILNVTDDIAFTASNGGLVLQSINLIAQNLSITASRISNFQNCNFKIYPAKQNFKLISAIVVQIGSSLKISQAVLDTQLITIQNSGALDISETNLIAQNRSIQLNTTQQISLIRTNLQAFQNISLLSLESSVTLDQMGKQIQRLNINLIAQSWLEIPWTCKILKNNTNILQTQNSPYIAQIISGRDVSIIQTQIQANNLSIKAEGNIETDTGIKVSQKIKNRLKDKPSLYISAQGSVSLTQDFVADKMSVYGGNGITYFKGQIISNPGALQPVPINQTQLTTPPIDIYDIAFVTSNINANIILVEVQILHYAATIQSVQGGIQMRNCRILSNMYGANYPGTYIRGQENITFSNIDIYSDQMDLQSNGSVTFTGTKNYITAYDDYDSSQIIFNASGSLVMTDYKAISTYCQLIGNQSITLSNTEIDVFSINQELYKKKRYFHNFKIFSENGPITLNTIVFNNIKDLSIVTNNSTTGDIVLNEEFVIFQTDFENSPDPTINIQAEGNLIFKKNLDLKSGTIKLQGDEGVQFLSEKVDILNYYMVHNVTEQKQHTFQIISENGNITSQLNPETPLQSTQFRIQAANFKVKANDIKLNNLEIVTFDFIAIQPNIYFDADSMIEIKQLQTEGGLMQFDGHDGVKIENFKLNCSAQDNSSFGYEDGIYINSKGNIGIYSGNMSGLNVKIVGKNVSFTDTVMKASRQAGSNNIALYANEYLMGENFIIKGGQMLFIGPNGILFDTTFFNIESNPNLIIYRNDTPSQMKLSQQRPHQEAITFISTHIISLKSSSQNSYIVGQSIKLESNIVNIEGITMVEDYDLKKTSLFNDLKVEIEGTKETPTGSIWFEETEVLTKENLIINCDNIRVTKSIIDVEEISKNKNTTISNLRFKTNSSVIIEKESVVNAKKIFISSQSTVKIDSNAQINIKEENSCNKDESSYSDIFQCIPRTSIDRNIDESEFLERYSQRFSQNNITDISQTYETLNQNFSIYVFAANQILLQQSSILSPRIGLCSTQVKLIDSQVDTSTRGCLSDQGLGSGVKFDGCAATGASFGGDGGPGARLLDSNMQIKCYKLHPVSYGLSTEDMRFEGSGGGSSLQSTQTGGSGGGIVWISAADRLVVQDSKILAEGGNGIDNGSNVGSGGGSGGSIFLLQSLLEGNGQSVSREVMDLLMEVDKALRSINWQGQLIVQGGQRGQLGLRQEWDSDDELNSEGTVWHPKCPPGHSGGFCEPCPAGTYKYGYSYGKCRFGSQYMAFAILGFILILTLLQWVCLIRKQKDKRNQATQNKIAVYVGLDQEAEHLHTQVNSDQDSDNQSQLLSNNTKLNDLITPQNIEMKEKDLWFHTHRLYLLGMNTIQFPWVLIKDGSQSILSQEDQQKLEMMILEHHDSLLWAKWQRVTFIVLKVLLPNIASQFHTLVRKRNYRKLQQILLQAVYCSKGNYNLAHLDFIDYTKSFMDYTGPQLPMIILISGTGSFNNPYNLGYNDDPYIKSILLLNKKQLKPKLPMFLENLDSLLKRLSFYNLTGQTLKDLNTLLEHIDFGNKHLFFPISIKLTLYLFENKLQKNGKQTRHSFPVDSQFFEAFPRTFKILMKYVKLRLFQKKSEIKFGIVFTKIDEEKLKKLNERINTFIQKRDTMLQQNLRGSTMADYDKVDEDDSMFISSDSQTQPQNNSQPKMNFSIQREDTMMFADCLDDDDYGDEFDQLDNVQDEGFEQRFKESIENKPQENIKSNEYLDTHQISGGFYVEGEKQVKTQDTSRLVYAFISLLYFIHLINPIDNMFSFGIIYYSIYPLMPLLSPIVGILSTIIGSPRLMKEYSKINSLLIIANYPITIISQLAAQDELFYIAMIFLLLLMKVRADLENPHFHKNRQMLKKMTKDKRARMSRKLKKSEQIQSQDGSDSDSFEFSSDDE
eukprot:403346737